ncbi:MAG: hypothetical protein JWR68_868 [Polaromonas sp.]|nr:hypothetical protein [Polaromonas sp.]
MLKNSEISRYSIRRIQRTSQPQPQEIKLELRKGALSMAVT